MLYIVIEEVISEDLLESIIMPIANISFNDLVEMHPTQQGVGNLQNYSNNINIGQNIVVKCTIY